ncbi:hypothetical protein [Chitinophaga sp. Cy-1792]|uniref:hypothetical protein n=1 Tax=Chitinophaga sp. Cy-1792 TaxID=2608339 RepID=UPI0014224BB5|nr:hypothetical protein [Chitinophaga sp. Cy-1792]NIG56405.1 hypothetical protein [Chitinophaga sp. Cy-1792]
MERNWDYIESFREFTAQYGDYFQQDEETPDSAVRNAYTAYVRRQEALILADKFFELPPHNYTDLKSIRFYYNYFDIKSADDELYFLVRPPEAPAVYCRLIPVAGGYEVVVRWCRLFNREMSVTLPPQQGQAVFELLGNVLDNAIRSSAERMKVKGTYFDIARWRVGQQPQVACKYAPTPGSPAARITAILNLLTEYAETKQPATIASLMELVSNLTSGNG